METLIALAILSTAIVGLVTAFSTAIRSGSTGRDAAKAETVLRTYAESVVRAPVGVETDGYRPCTGGAVPAYTPMTVDGFTASVVDVAYWVAGSSPATFGGCANDGSGVQRVTMQVAWPRGATTSLQLFVRQVA